ncbi:MAG: PIG-L family deacetylase [Zavarzinella sp.]
MDAATESFDLIAVAPHPDDLEITCGGTLAKMVQLGYRVGIIDLTSGEPTPRGSEAQRQLEAEKARTLLGVPLRINLNMPNRILMDTPEYRFVLATELRKYRPKIVMTIAGRTPAASPDHHQAHMLAEASRFYSQLTKWDDRFADTEPYRVPHLIYAPFAFDGEQRMWHSTFVVDISDTFDQKLAAVQAYESQFDPARFERVKHFLTGQAAYHGARCGFRYGEMFALPHPIGTADPFQLVMGGHSGPAPVQIPGKDHLPTG